MYEPYLSLKYEEVYVIKWADNNRHYDRWYHSKGEFNARLQQCKDEGLKIKFAGRYVLEETVE